MVAVDKIQLSKTQRDQAEHQDTPPNHSFFVPLEDLDSAIETQLSRAKARRVHAEAARQKITAEIMDATRRLYQTLVEEGEQTLERAKKLEAEAELKLLESQTELQRAQGVRQEADAYREKVISQTKDQAQEMMQQAQSIKADAVTFREKVLLDLKQQTSEELEQAQTSRVQADSYRERVISQVQKQSEEILKHARQAAEQEGLEIKQKYTIEAQKVLAQAELIKAAAEEQLEAQRLYAEAANLETESREVLNQARSKMNKDNQIVELKPVSVQEDEDVSAVDYCDIASNLHKTPQGAESNLNLELEALELESEEAGPRIDAEISEISDQPKDEDSLEEVPAVVEEPSVALSEAADNSALLPANELVLGFEHNQQCRAYPISTVAEKKVINDSLDGLNLVVTFGPPSDLGMMFNRQVDGTTLTFERLPRPHNGIALMKDKETGTIWEALTGRAISGPLAHQELDRLNSEYSFWFAWIQLHPATEVYGHS